MQFFAQRAERDFEIFQDGIALILRVKGVFFGARDGVLRFVKHTTEAAGLLRVDQIFDRSCVQHGLHELLRGLEIKERTFRRRVAHLENAALLVPNRVRLGAHGNANNRLVARE